MAEQKPAARPDGWIFRIVVALAGVYVVGGILASLPMLGRMREIGRVAREAEARFGNDPAKLVACLESEGKDLREACEGRLVAAGTAVAPHAPYFARRLVAETSPGKRYPDDRTASILLAAAGLAPPDPRQAAYERPEERARRALAALGPGAVRELADDLKSASVNARWRALYALELVGPAALEFAPAVTPFVTGPEPVLRAQAVRTVGALGRAAFDKVDCDLVAIIVSKDREEHAALSSALAAIALPFGEWQSIIGRCRRAGRAP